MIRAIILLMFIALVPSVALAAEVPSWLDSIGQWLAPLISGFVSKYPVISAVVFVMGGLRMLFKPLVAAIRAYVDYTPNPADNRALDKVEASTAFKAVLFVLDWFASIKIVR